MSRFALDCPRDRLALWLCALLFTFTSNSLAVEPNVEADRRQFREHYFKLFPHVAPDDFVLGVYAIDAQARAQYEAINEFPPYEFALDEGRVLAEQPFANGTKLGECLESAGPGLHEYPYFDEAAQTVVTLAFAVNRCRIRNGELALDYRRGELSKILAYLATIAHDTRRAVSVPRVAGAKAAYTAGKQFFHTKRGQLNLSCADCHVHAVGKRLREQTLTPLLGVLNRYPVYGLNWGALGSLHQRFVGCMEQVRAEPFYPQSEIYRELEYFLANMGNGLPMVGPGIHR